MSFETEILKNINSPVIITTFDRLQEQEFWTNYLPNIWFFNLYGSYPNIDDDFENSITINSYTAINQVYQDNVLLAPVQDITECIATRNSWYYSAGQGNVYIHTDKRPVLSDIEISTASLFFRKGGPNSAYIDGIYYEDKIISIPSISKKKTDIFNGKLVHEGGAINIDNHDGAYDSFLRDNNYLGQLCKIYVGFDGYTSISQFEKKYEGYTESIITRLKQVTFNVKSRQKSFSINMPVNSFDSTTYPNINEDNENKPIPICYGQCRNVPVICVNEDETPPVTYTFLICDMTYHSAISAIDAVYVEGVEVIPDSTDLAAGSFTITSASGDYTPGDEVTADVQGYEDSDGNLIENAIEILLDLLSNYFGYNSSVTLNYAHINTADALDMNLFLNETKKFWEIIEIIAKTSLLNFIIEDDNRIGIRIFTENAPFLTIFDNNNCRKFQSIKSDITKLITSTEMKYNPDYAEDKYLIYPYDAEEADLYDIFNFYNRKEFIVNLIDTDNCDIFSARVLEIFGGEYEEFSVETNLEALNREVGDTVKIELVRPLSPNYGTWLCEIVGIDKDFSNYLVRLTLRPFRKVSDTSYTKGVYYGQYSFFNGYIFYYNNDDYYLPTAFKQENYQ